MKPLSLKIIWLAALLVLLLSACAGQRQQDTPEPFIVPTLSTGLTPVATPTNTPLPASPTPVCTNDLRYIDDLTIPDGTVVDAGQQLDKRWQVENQGICNWDASYSLRLITGSELGAQSPLPLFPATAGSTAVIRILYTAPEESGVYRSAWQAHDPGGAPFGDPIFIEVVVP